MDTMTPTEYANIDPADDDGIGDTPATVPLAKPDFSDIGEAEPTDATYTPEEE
ncbi:hypothetical protein QDA03_gp70 [Microbacterium phage Terij]|uniref:Uncharacterized protein n=1 Tax=Microbacterium phage Terij TaxID=2686229 RepID=A0A6B9LCW1_9CAUD|nr:hypothetical protein QDA03_gp70 [Microbacterium phage Terij]QHB37171.1 hypothetical protein SEA_TERIJ_37 [Microbacterium phage Terij]